MKNNPTELTDSLKVIRTIHSNKARVYSSYNNAYLIISIIVAIIVTFIGFTGPENVQKIIFCDQELNSSFDQLPIMNLMTLLVLIITVLSPILRFEKKMNKNFGAVVRLTEFISDLEFKYHGQTQFNSGDLHIYSERYKSLINSLPQVKDKDYYFALKTIKKKKRIKDFIASSEYESLNLFERKWKIFWL